MKKTQKQRLKKVLTGKVTYVILDGDEVVCMGTNFLGIVNTLSQLQKENPNKNYDMQVLEE